MKLMLTSLAITSLGLSSIASLPKSEIAVEKQTIFSGTKQVNVTIQENISDAIKGKSQQTSVETANTFEWSDIQINKTILSKMDFTRSWIRLYINYWYADNSGIGNSGVFNSTEDLVVTDLNAKKEGYYENERYHSGDNRLSDHEWAWNVTVTEAGIFLWDWIWVWANGNVSNRAFSAAGISINSFEYHFEFLT